MFDFSNLIKRCRVSLSPPDTDDYPHVQVEYNGKVKDVEVIMPYGVSARIPVDALGHKFVLNGDESDQAAIFNTPTKRLKQDVPGEVEFGSPEFLNSIRFKADGSVLISNGASSGAIEITADGKVIINGIEFGVHTHSGVEPGGSSTGGPS